MDKLEPQFIGQVLLGEGFKSFFLYLFKIIEQRPFIVEPLHEKLFDYFQAIYDGKKTRCCINIAPRSAKTTLSQYFLVYILTRNPKSQIIYTSYSQSLLTEISNKIASILEHPVYKALYPIQIYKETEDTQPVDDFWREYLFENTGKNTYSSKIIKTYAGGICLFASCGSQITGYGAGIRNSKTFGGCLIIDDAQKPIDTKSSVLRKKVFTYFEETLLSRLNNPNVPIINVQQRLHKEDLSGFLIETYKFDKLAIPLVDKNGVCQIPSQYTEKRIKELQLNNFLWHSQYLQEPIVDAGNLIKTDWFNYYPLQSYDYQKIVISADTAMTVKESADYTCFLVGGITTNGKLHIMDMVHGRFEFPELKQQLVNLYNKYQYTDGITTSCSEIVIENKASGIQLIQELQANTGLPIIPVEVTKDKLTRVEEVMSYIASGNVLLPVDNSYGFNPELLNECAEFNREQTQIHDDICFVGNTKIATLFGYKQIKDIKKGDLIITPYGLQKVIASACTGEHEVIKNIGLEATPNHKIYNNNKFTELKDIENDKEVSKLNLCNLIKWKFKILLYSMVLNIDLWGQRGIILANQGLMKEDATLRDYMLLFGNIIADRQFLKVILFIIKMVIAIITTSLIWSVFLVANILKDINNRNQNLAELLNILNILAKLEILQKFGIKAKKVRSGIKNMLLNLWLKHGHIEKKKNVLYVGRNLFQKPKQENIVVNNAKLEHIEKEKKLVYSLTVDKAHVYYANNILVANCDALVHLINSTIANRTATLFDCLEDFAKLYN